MGRAYVTMPYESKEDARRPGVGTSVKCLGLKDGDGGRGGNVLEGSIVRAVVRLDQAGRSA